MRTQEDLDTVKPEAGVVHTSSISSSVELDYVHNLAHKVYHPSWPVKLLYWLAFQAPFPYIANHDALEAARQRRIIVDLLTKFWFGHHLVASVVDIQDTAGGAHDFVTQLVIGKEPERKREVWRFLKSLDAKFLAAGLPTWQVTPYNPHAITNFIRTTDGTYRIIDLESSLVALLYPLSSLFRLMRAGIFPSFDDIDVKRLSAYVAANETGLAKALAGEWRSLLTAIDSYEAAAERWHASEPRYLPRLLRRLALLVPWWH